MGILWGNWVGFPIWESGPQRLKPCPFHSKEPRPKGLFAGLFFVGLKPLRFHRAGFARYEDPIVRNSGFPQRLKPHFFVTFMARLKPCPFNFLAVW
jgi:hypothetical protein